MLIKKVPRNVLYLNIFLLLVFLLVVGFILFGQKSKNKVASSTTKALEKQVQESCTKDQSYDCYIKAFKQTYDKSGPKDTLTTLVNLSSSDEVIRRDCHPYAHELGRYSFNKIGDALKAFSYGSTVCSSGYYHGVMEGFLTQVRNEKKELKSEIVNLCDAKDGDSRFMAFQCLHGLGHGLTMYFGSDIMKSLPYCDSLKTDWDQSSCYGGVFMENIVVNNTPGHKSLYTKKEDPEYPCNFVEEKYKFSCYYLASSWYLQVVNYDYKQAFNLCDKSNSNYIWVCYQSMGRDISGSTLRDPDRSLELCQQGNKDRFNDCIIGVVKDFTNTTAAPTEGAIFCQKIAKDSKGVCYNAAGQILADIYSNKKELERVCKELTSKEPAYQKNCLAV